MKGFIIAGTHSGVGKTTIAIGLMSALIKRGSTGTEGYLYKNTLCSYVHLHFGSNPEFAEGFIKKCRSF